MLLGVGVDCQIIVAENNFHGRTMSAISASNDPDR